MGASADTVDAYIAAAAPEAREVLQKIRATILKAAPQADETIGYRMPAYSLHGVLIYFAAHKAHIGIYPPAKGDRKLMQDIAPYANERGNLRFPLDQVMPYALIERVVRARLRENLERAEARRRKAKR